MLYFCMAYFIWLDLYVQSCVYWLCIKVLHIGGSSSTETCSSLNLNLPSPCGSEAVTEPSALYHSETPNPLQEEYSGPTPSNV